jgi:hypothetical protein
MEKEKQNIQVGMIPDYWTATIKIPDVQREDTAWTLEQQQMLIDSLYNNYDIPKIYLRIDEENPEIWWLLDGQQRLTNIVRFLKNEFPLGDFTSLPKEVRNKFYNELTPQQKAKIKGRTLDFVLMNCTEEEEEDLFLRLNKGTPLNAAEKRNAIKGEARDLAKSLAEHKFFKEKINFSTLRYADHAVCAQLIFLALKNEPTDTKGRQLKELYEQKKRFPEKSTIEYRVKKILNKLQKIFPKKEIYMKKYNVLSCFLFLNELENNYSISSIKEQEFYDFLNGFEIKRKQNNQKSEDDTDFDKSLYLYTLACVNSPDSKESLKTRQEILLRKFFIDFPEVELKDKNRNFTPEQKEAIYLICSKKCQGVEGFNCPHKSEDIPFDEAEFDHKDEHTDGGLTIVSNGQLLCNDCHSYKTTQNRKKRKITTAN